MATQILVVLDESGSMGFDSALQEATMSGYNQFIEDQRKENLDEAYVTLVKFNYQAAVVFDAKPIKDVPRLNNENYMPGGGTALYDGIFYGVRAVEKVASSDDGIIVAVITDGLENSSREATKEQVLDMIKGKEAQGNYTFVYVGANQDAWNVGQSIGLRGGNIGTYDANSVRSTNAMYANLSSGVRTRRAGGVAGQMATSDFYEEAGVAADASDEK